MAILARLGIASAIRAR